MKVWLCVIAAVILGASPAAKAQIIGTSGAVAIVASPPADVSSNQWESNTQIRVFAEQQNLTLGQALKLDISMAGTSPGDTDSNLSPVSLPAGSVISSYMFHYDPNGSRATSNALEETGSITFSETVLGLIVLSDSLNDANGIVGLPGVTYAAGADHGLDLSAGKVGTGTADEVMLSADRHTVTMDLRAASFADDVRIITAVPEPSSLNVLVAATAAILGAGRRVLKRSGRPSI